VLSIAGVSAYHFSPWIAVAVVVLMFTVVASYRQNVHAYPSGGGDYEVATTNLDQGGAHRRQRAAGRLRAQRSRSPSRRASRTWARAVPFFVTHKVLAPSA